MYGIILFLIVYFIYLIVKYSGTEKPEYNLQYFRDKEHIKYPAIIVGYLDNKTIKVEHFKKMALIIYLLLLKILKLQILKSML